MGKKILLLVFLVGYGWPSYAQEINFSTYADYHITVEELDNNELHFGQIVTGSGTYEIGINNGKVISITGIEYLDVIVEVTADNDLYLDGNPGNAGDDQKSIPFTLKAAYANNKGIPTIGQAKMVTEISGDNSFVKRIPLLERQHQPPGPPPAPPTNATELAELEENVHLYLYGDIHVGEIDAGAYSAQITVTINYD